MEPDAIQKRALATWYEPNDHPLLHDDLLPSILGLVGEAGEVADLYKKDCFKPGYTASDEAYLDELGDVLYYVAILAHQFGITLDDLSQMNRQKLEGGKHGWADNNP